MEGIGGQRCVDSKCSEASGYPSHICEWIVLSLVLSSINYTGRNETFCAPAVSAPPAVFLTPKKPRRLWIQSEKNAPRYVLAVHLWTRQAQRSSQREVLTGPRRSSRTRRGPHYRDLARRHIKQDKALANPLFGLLGACGAILDVATQGRFSLEGFHYCVLGVPREEALSISCRVRTSAL